MDNNTHLSNTINSIAADKAMYDKNVKELFADIQILAWIVKYTVAEVEQYSIDKIMEYIDVESIKVGGTVVQPGMTNLGKVESQQNENYIPNEGYVTFDIRFILKVRDKELSIIINIEAQKSTDFRKLNYHIENRIIFYLARLISAQKDKEFFKSDYDSKKKYIAFGFVWMGVKKMILLLRYP